jgi:ABC-type multidrug transport system fused ATPase/permease subunit
MTGGPISQLAQQYLNMQQVIGSVQRVLEMLDIPTESDDPRRTVALPAEVGAVRFEDVAFSYDPSGPPVLVDVNFEVERGEKLAIVGSSGAGKTTIVGLLMGLYNPTRGAILVDGYDISRLRLDSLRSRIALVSQDTFLFNTPVMDNIRYARPDASEDDVVEAARAAYAHDFISRLPSGYATVIGERGVTLSGGQRQRLAIAQAFLKGAPILVLDEAMSAVDSEAEEMIQESLRRLMRDKTVVLISHRMSALDLADKIAVLADGTIVATGPHADLVHVSGLYRTLWMLQQSGKLTLESG